VVEPTITPTPELDEMISIMIDIVRKWDARRGEGRPRTRIHAAPAAFPRNRNSPAPRRWKGTFMQLTDESRITVVGGGPAGSFFALYLRLFGDTAGVHPKITIYQDHNFDEPGVHSCKGCAGILSLSLLRNWKELGLTIPEEIIQTRIDHYAVHSLYTSISIKNPDRDAPIVSVYRGGGPRLSPFDHRVSFDGWLLAQAAARDVTVESRSVSAVSLGTETTAHVDGQRHPSDLIVFACGAGASIPIHGLGYTPPETRMMAQDELFAGADEVKARLGTVAHAFLIPHSDVIFGTLVPKGPFINVSVLSSGTQPVSVTEFLNYEIVKEVLPRQYVRSCGCKPRAAVGCAANYYADRFVAIGDAAVSRLYKDGVGSALATARRAAHTVVEHGWSRRDFERHYAPLCREIARDNGWGELLFALNKRAKDSRTFLLAQHRLISDEQDNMKGSQPLTRAAWGMFTGSYSYRAIARMALSPSSLVKLSLVLVKDSLRNFGRKQANPRRRLYVGKRRVLILGSGFGGTYTLRHLVRSLNKNENIETTMVSSENFFLFSPLLHEVAMGGIETRHIAYPIRRLHWRDRFNFVQAEVEKIDLAGRQVATSAGALPYDFLVIALGSVSVVPAFEPRARKSIFTLKTLHDSMSIRNHIISKFEQASRETDQAARRRLLTFAVSGAGYTGVQVVTELSDFIHRTLVRFYRTVEGGDVRILLVETEPRIIGDLDPRLGAYAMRQIKKVGIEIRLRSQVTQVGADSIEINGEEMIPTETLLWVAGVTANPRVAELDVTRDRIGRVLVDRYLELPAFPGVYAVGDSARFVDEGTGQAIPPRAHTAVRQARVAAKNILADIRGYNKQPYGYSQSSEGVSLGASRAVFRYRRIRVYGFAAKLIWLVAYSFLVTGAYNRVRIVNDWILTRLFGRDTTYLKL
jgi:NADH dehydrogenase